MRQIMTGKPLAFKEIQALQILRASGLTYNAIAEQINRSPKTIKKACLNPVIASEIKEIQEELADAYEGLSRRILESITQEDIQKLNAYQRMIAAGIATDKMRLLRNESTENISMAKVEMNRKEIAVKCAEVEKRIRELKGEKTETHQKKSKALEDKKTRNEKEK